ncbi:CPSF A subunit region-domain-containing protein [Radiomyces spectabilis]|uniref:CPSF A subunit region-domain-containing protein n=1 Tax=Radiomyces spectabilis TaxID=64574 RepID=UPI00221EDC4B|nr:CPSF A subunit region-domain-containing protein [Radiomyces spectabilis]KAI8373001.1 CPSF A subunit region-domain-containing protein [Radiomyces spectabilis]
MYLYNLTLNPSSAINQAIHGNFSGTKQQELIVARQTRLELLRPDPNTGKVHTILSHEMFGLVRTIAPFRLTGASKDYVVVGSDSGRIVILEYNPAKNVFDKVHQETYGKTGCRRIVPGQYLATDPKGRAVMIAAAEKQKLVYILNRDSAARLTISSPLEAHKSHTIIHHITGLDVGFENPTFACLEVDYSDADQDPTGDAAKNAEKLLTYYELDLGLNHVVRKWSEPVHFHANMLISVPGGNDGPSGVLVCTENFITYKHQDMPEVRIPIPRRAQPLEDSSRGIIIVAAAVHKMKINKKTQFFFLIQSEEGDLYKVTMDHAEGVVQGMTIKYFDTIPVATSLCILKSGFLFAANEFGNHHHYSFENLGDDPDDPEISSADYMEAEEAQDETPLVYFKPRPLKNLMLVDELESLAPVTDAKVLNLADEDTPRIYTLCGRGSRSTLRILNQGLEASELAVSELPGNPSAVWTTKLRHDDQYHAYIVVSFANATLVLSIGETVEEVTDTGFLATAPTIDVVQLGEDALIQVYPQGIRHIRADRRVNEWRAPAGQSIVQAATNNRQVVVALSDGEIVYFELDNMGQLNEHHERKQMSSNITCLAIGDVPEGRQRSRHLAVGCDDQTVRILSLDPDSCLESISMQAVQGVASSLCIAEMFDTGVERGHGTQYLNIGLSNGVLLRTILDTITGQLSDTRTRFIGAKSIKLFKIEIQGRPAVLALSSKPWVSYTFQSRLYLTPLSYDMLEYGSPFISEQCPDGVVAVAGNTLRIFTVEKLGSIFNQVAIPLKYTPRKFALHLSTRTFVVVESDYATFSPAEKQKELAIKEKEGFEIDEDITNLDPLQFGHVRNAAGKWASCIRLVEPFQGATLHELELEENEAAFSVAMVQFRNNPHSNDASEQFVAVGTGKDVQLAPKSCSGGFIHLYRIVSNEAGGLQLSLIHKTPVEDVPTALLGFQGRLLAGIGKALRIYDIGRKKMLRKCENKSIPNQVVSLHTQGDRIVMTDIQESVHYAVYKHADNRIVVFADDTTPRWMTASAMIDYDTIAGGDKFGNFFVDRLPQSTSQDIDEDTTGNRIFYEKGYLHGAPNKVDNLCHYFTGDIITSLHRTTLISGGREVLLATSFLGGISLYVPFVSKEDVDFFQMLEMHMRAEAPPLAGRDHLAYRSFYVPVKSVVDGDLCEQFNLLPAEKRRMIADELDRSVSEVQKKIEDMRVRSGF